MAFRRLEFKSIQSTNDNIDRQPKKCLYGALDRVAGAARALQVGHITICPTSSPSSVNHPLVDLDGESELYFLIQGANRHTSHESCDATSPAVVWLDRD